MVKTACTRVTDSFRPDVFHITAESEIKTYAPVETDSYYTEVKVRAVRLKRERLLTKKYSCFGA